LIEPAFVRVGLRAADWEDALRQLSAELQSAGHVTSDHAQAVVDRELRYPTGLPGERYGVAIPHADPEYTALAGIGVATLAEPVSFRMMGDADEEVAVSVVVMLALQDAEAQLAMLRQLAELIADGDRLADIAQATGPDDIRAVLSAIDEEQS